MLVCFISQRARGRALAAELDETAQALDASTSGHVVFATLVDDPASVSDSTDAYLGEIMLEAASANDTPDAGLDYAAAIAEAVTAADVPDGSSGGAAVARSAIVAGPVIVNSTSRQAEVDGIMVNL